MNLDLGVGTVVRIKQYPFTDQTGSKTAPAVVLSSRLYHVERGELVTARITSKIHHKNTFGTVVISDHEACGLPEPSIIKPVIMTVLISHVQRVVGRLDEKTFEDLRQLFVKEIFAELLGQSG